MSNSIRRILIADDYDIVRRGVRNMLEARPNLRIVAEAANGREALEEAKATEPDIAIVDYSLSDLNGLELTRALKREMPRVEVLIFTMHDREDLVREVVHAGAKGFVLKSDAEHHLLAAIDALSIHRPYISGTVSEKLSEQFLETPQDNKATLTLREREVVRMVAEGRQNKQIAHGLDLSVKTVETHRAAAMFKLKIRNTAQLVRYALRNNISQT